MELGPAIARMRLLAAANEGLHSELAASLLARLGPIDSAAVERQACPGPSIQVASEPRSDIPVYVRCPKLLKVRFRKLAPGEPLRRMLQHFARHPQPQTMHEIAVATGLIRKSVQNVFTGGDRFQRDGIDPLLWTLKV